MEKFVEIRIIPFYGIMAFISISIEKDNYTGISQSILYYAILKKKLLSGSVDSDLGTEQTAANSIENVWFFITFLNSFFDKKTTEQVQAR